MDNKRGSILVVDDDGLNRTLLTANLEEQGYTVRTAENGRQALDQLRAQPFDVVLLDVLMPEMDGYQTLAEIKRDPALQHLPVIVVSALDETDSVIRCIELGATDYLPKPFEPALLKARITASLAAKRLRDLELEYLEQVGYVTHAATALESGVFEADKLNRVAARHDALGQLARVFQEMAREIQAREQRMALEASEREQSLQQQLTELRFELDKVRPMLHDAFDLTPPFDFLTFQEKDWLAGRLRTMSYPDGSVIASPDDAHYDVLFLLFDGRVIVRRSEGDTLNGPGRVDAPAYFGEESVFFHHPPRLRTIADGPARCFLLAGEDVRALVAQNAMFSQAFATALRHKQRIFGGYDAFVNLLFTKADAGTVQLQELVEAYQTLHPILHQAASPRTLDLDAIGYVIPRLPSNIMSTSALLLTEELPEMYRPIRETLRLPTRRARKREFYLVLPDKIIALLRDRTTDTVDLITKLCILAVETNKIRERLRRAPMSSTLAEFVIRGGTHDTADEILAALPFTPGETIGLKRIFGDDLFKRLYEILAQVGDLTIYFEKPNHRYTMTSSELWLSQIRKALGEIVTPDEFERGLDVHIISSNTHSVSNCLSTWLHERLDGILQWAEAAVPDSLGLAKPTDRLYHVFRAWAEKHPAEAARRAAGEHAHGILTLNDLSFTGIEVQFIDANRVGPRLDPDIGSPALSRRTLIVNFDYAYGQQAELIMRDLILLFGRRIQSISIFGKSGGIVGERGDILMPDQLLLQTNDQLYPIPNQDLTPEDLGAAGCDRPVHLGTMLTILGTIMQSREMLYYYRHFWNAIGMEMEGSFYLREILRARSLGLLPDDVQLRFAYYTSDTPLEPNASLASTLTAEEGVPAVYAITRAVLRRILSPERD